MVIPLLVHEIVKATFPNNSVLFWQGSHRFKISFDTFTTFHMTIFDFSWIVPQLSIYTTPSNYALVVKFIKSVFELELNFLILVKRDRNVSNSGESG